jgi:hypothetical protein
VATTAVIPTIFFINHLPSYPSCLQLFFLTSFPLCNPSTSQPILIFTLPSSQLHSPHKSLPLSSSSLYLEACRKMAPGMKRRFVSSSSSDECDPATGVCSIEDYTAGKDLFRMAPATLIPTPFPVPGSQLYPKRRAHRQGRGKPIP